MFGKGTYNIIFYCVRAMYIINIIILLLLVTISSPYCSDDTTAVLHYIVCETFFGIPIVSSAQQTLLYCCSRCRSRINRCSNNIP